MPPTRADRKAETRSRVLTAALELFTQTGFEATSTADIARRAGVGHGTVFTIAATKERLALMAFQDRLREIGDTALAACRHRPTFAERLDHVFEALYDFYAQNPELSRILIKEQIFVTSPDDRAQQEQLLKEFLGGLGQLALEAQGRGEIIAGVNIPNLIAGIFSIYLLFLLALLSNQYPSRALHRQTYRGALQTLLLGNLHQPLS